MDERNGGFGGDWIWLIIIVIVIICLFPNFLGGFGNKCC